MDTQKISSLQYNVSTGDKILSRDSHSVESLYLDEMAVILIAYP
jgi:hypothetical protein